MDAPVRLLFLSEGNTCRSVLAEGFLTRLLADRGLEAQFSCESKGTRDYNAGEGCDAATRAVGPAFGLHYLEYHVARATDFAVDINTFDVLLPVDKFTAADVLRECTVYATVNPRGGYVAKVRTLAEFNPSGCVLRPRCATTHVWPCIEMPIRAGESRRLTTPCTALSHRMAPRRWPPSRHARRSFLHAARAWWTGWKPSPRMPRTVGNPCGRCLLRHLRA